MYMRILGAVCLAVTFAGFGFPSLGNEPSCHGKLSKTMEEIEQQVSVDECASNKEAAEKQATNAEFAKAEANRVCAAELTCVNPTCSPDKETRRERTCKKKATGTITIGKVSCTDTKRPCGQNKTIFTCTATATKIHVECECQCQ